MTYVKTEDDLKNHLIYKAEKTRGSSDKTFFVKPVKFMGQQQYSIRAWISDVEIMVIATCYKPLIAENLCKKMNLEGSKFIQ